MDGIAKIKERINIRGVDLRNKLFCVRQIWEMENAVFLRIHIG
jgi:hypothetical protein